MKHLLLLTTAVAAVTAGCGGSFPDTARVEAAPVAAASSARRGGPDPHVSRPVRIACLQDKSGSAALTRTPQLTLGELAPLIGLLRECGGELAVGIIHGSVRMQMARIRIERPPAPPKPPPSGAGNPLAEAEQESARHDYQIEFEKRLTNWETEVNSRLETFHSELGRLLKVSSDSRSSPVWAAVRRADVFLAESDTSWPEPPSRYAVVLSDGEDNTTRAASALSAGATWLMVNGDGKIGSLGSLNPKRFESVRAAFEDVVASERGK